MGELHVVLLDGGVDVFVDEVVGAEAGDPTGGARASYFLYDRSRVDRDRFVVVLTQIDVDLRRRRAVEVVGCAEISEYVGAEWTHAFWVGDRPGQDAAPLRQFRSPRSPDRLARPPRPRPAPHEQIALEGVTFRRIAAAR